MPDDELLALAEAAEAQPSRTRSASRSSGCSRAPKAAAFTENFVGQWLGLRDIDATEPSHIFYPEFDHMLKVSMVRETELFFDEVLKNDLSLTNFVASDFTMLNGRLAKHYGIPGVDGWEFRKMTLPPDSHRGGVLTMASVLKVTANGTDTSPVLRGAWVLDRILGTPPPPPARRRAGHRARHSRRHDDPRATGQAPSNRLLRRLPSPRSIRRDLPWRSFDVIGGWRDHYRTTGLGENVFVDGRRMPYLKGKKVDPGDVTADGERFENIDRLKQILSRDKPRIARALTVKLITYATGRAPGAIGRNDGGRNCREHPGQGLWIALADS